jgi:hypothetical protein
MPFSMADDGAFPEEQPENYACQYGESEAAGEPPYWATWGF